MMRAIRLGLALGFLLTVAACASQSTDASGNSGASGNGAAGNSSGGPVSSTILPGPTTTGPPTQTNRASPDSRAVSLRPVRWTRAEAGDGKQLLVRYTATGRADCNVLGRVDVAETSAKVVVTVFLGQAPGADCGGVQPMIAAEFVTTVTLREPLGARTVADGANR